MYIYSSLLIRLIIIVIVLFKSNYAYSQQADDIPIVNKLRSYSGKMFQEKLFLHTDREFYTAGEILWFKIYYVDAAFHKPADLSKVAYVEILSEINQPVLQAAISLLPGECNGSFYLPTSLPTGNYTIRSYTNWMKNFDAGYFFEKKITIVNTIKVSALLPIKDTVSTTVNFFPEGGNLVNDIESKVGFTVTDSKGGVNNCQGYILDKDGDTITSFSPLKFGIGNFNFKPAAGNTYKAIVDLPGGIKVTKAMPVAFDNGYIIRLSENDREQLVINIQRKSIQGAGNSNEQLLLAVHTRQVLKAAEKILVGNNSSSIVLLIDKNKLGSGVIHFTLFNGNDKPVCERLFFIKPLPGVSIIAKSDQLIYNKRQKINFTVSPQNNAETTPSLNLSASVFKVDTLQMPDNVTIAPYMWLSSDMPGTIESAGYYFSNDPDVNKATDNLMLTHGWRRFKWDNILNDDESLIKYLPEINGQLVKGRVMDSRNNQPAQNTLTYLTIQRNPFGFYVAESDKNGWVNFEIKKYYGPQQMIARPGVEADSFYTVDIVSPFAEVAPGRKYAPYQLQEDIKELLIQKSISMQTQNIYTSDSIRNFRNPSLLDSLPFFGLPEVGYSLDEYVRFTTMEEVLREYVRPIDVGVKNGNLVLKLFSTFSNDYKDHPFVLLDGVPLSDPNKIFSYDPLKIKKLDIITNHYIIGSSIFNSVVSFSTYEGNFIGFELDPKVLAIDYSALQLQREFYSPVYETKEQLEKRIPDFRNTLFWSPDITTNKEGKATFQFYASDQAGNYIAILQGISKNGDPVYSYTSFQVQ